MDIFFIIYGIYLIGFGIFSLIVGYTYFFDMQKIGILTWFFIFIPPFNSFRIPRKGHAVAYTTYILIYLLGGGTLVYYNLF